MNIFSSIIVIFCKLSSFIVRVRDNDSLISSEMILKGESVFVNYRHLLQIIVNYCQGERQRIFDLIRNAALKGWIFLRQLLSFIVNYRQLLSEWKRTNLLLSLQKWSLKVNMFSSIIFIYCKLSTIIVRVKKKESLQNYS